MPLLTDKNPLPQPKKCKGPLWDGPESDSLNGGVTQSLIGRFLSCRERFRLYAMEGLRPSEGWNHRLGYGSMWHVCEEQHAKDYPWDGALADYTRDECLAHPMDRKKIEHWYDVCVTQFPIYVEYWANHPDVLTRTPLMQEQVFNVPYGLPSGRVVRLRGKWDSVDLIGNGKDAGIYLQENKTKGDVDEAVIKRQLTFDLQTMTYLVALKESRVGYGEHGSLVFGGSYPIQGVRYNVVRRPLSGGKGTIVQRKGSKNVPAETKEQFLDRLAEYIRAEPDHYFMRFKVEVTPADIQRFRRECLDPILEQMCDWYSWVKVAGDNVFSPDDGCENSQDQPVRSSIHWRHPFGIYSPLDDGGFSDVESYIESRSMVGLKVTDCLFPELKE